MFRIQNFPEIRKHFHARQQAAEHSVLAGRVNQLWTKTKNQLKKTKTDGMLQAMLSCPLILVIHCTYWSGRVDYQMDCAIAS